MTDNATLKPSPLAQYHVDYHAQMVEYAGSIIFEQTSVGDYANNMLDLVANLVGSIAAVVVVRFLPETSPRTNRHESELGTIEN